MAQMRPTATASWRRGVVVSGVRRMNEVNARRARLLPGWVVTGPMSEIDMGPVYSVCNHLGYIPRWYTRLRAGIPSRYVTSQLGQLSLASLWGRLIEYQLRLGVRAGMSPLPGGR